MDDTKDGAQDGKTGMAMLLVDGQGKVNGDASAFAELLHVEDEGEVVAALCKAAGRDLAALSRGGPVRLTANRTAFVVSAQAVPGGTVLLLQEVEQLLACADPREEQRDELTGLLARSAFERQLAMVCEAPMPGIASASLALHLIDLDGFKGVNDSLGHAMGDRLLAIVARRLRALLRDGDIAARLGGDEFAVMQFGEGQPESASTLAARIVEVIGRPYVVDGHMIDIGASIGIAIGDCEPQSSGERLLRNADLAMYRAKEGGKGRFRFYEEGMDAALQERRQMEIDLRQALAFRQFELFYQPQMRVSDERICGMEALLRWNHPTRGLLGPDEFIPLAEETGIIVPIGEWTLRTACMDAAAWPDDMTVAVNVSARQLVAANLLDSVDTALAQAGLPASRLEIEITETVLMSDKEACLAVLHGLRQRGVRISMDDFGTGYSSLSYLQSFPFDKLKIDRSFVSDLENDKNSQIVGTISTLGKVLGMETIAEGVETDAQLRGIGTLGCDTVQGYHISRPSKLTELQSFLSRQSSGAQVKALPPLGEEAASGSANEALFQLVYYSRNAMFSYSADLQAEIAGVLEVSRRNNTAVGVTGALLFNAGFFAQVLEGPRDAVEETFERIQLDDRHSDIVLVSCAPVKGRCFADWSMAHVGAATMTAGYETAETRGAFDPARFASNELVDHLSRLLNEEAQFAAKAA